jgi:hypothetical protein
VGGHLFSDGWDGTELRARRLPKPEKVEKAKDLAHKKLTSILRVLGYSVLPKEVSEWPDAESSEYVSERAAHGRYVAARDLVEGALRDGHVVSSLVTDRGDRVDVPPHCWEQSTSVPERPRVFANALLDATKRRVTAQYSPRRVVHVKSLPDLLGLPRGHDPVRDDLDRAELRGVGPTANRTSGTLYVDRKALLACLTELPRAGVAPAAGDNDADRPEHVPSRGRQRTDHAKDIVLPRNQQTRKEAREVRDQKIQQEAEQIWKCYWDKYQTLLTKGEVAEALLKDGNQHELLRDVRARHGELLRQETIVRILSEPELVRTARSGGKNIQPGN